VTARPQQLRPSGAKLVTYVDLAQWAGITLTEAERRFGSPGGPERLRIAGEDCLWEHDARRLLRGSPDGG
jgi:hypothetical protein